MPLKAGEVTQTDEVYFILSIFYLFKDELGLTYEELSILGRLRRPGHNDPYTMFIELLPMWHPHYTYEQVIFFKYI